MALKISGGTVQMQKNGLFVHVCACEGNMLRLRANRTGRFEERETLVVLDSPKTMDGGIVELEHGARLSLDGIQLELSDSLGLRAFDAARNLLFSTSEPMFDERQGRLCFSWALQPDERIYGLGQAANEQLNLRGKLREIWNQWDFDNCGSAGIPFLYSSQDFALLVNTSWASRFLLGGNEPSPKTPFARPKAPWEGDPTVPCAPDECRLLTEDPELDIFLMFGKFERCALGYRRLTGAAQMPPKWALGYIQSKFGYISQDELLDVARGFALRRIPCGAFMLDITIFQRLGDLVMDPLCWPDVRSLTNALDRMGMRLIAGQHPFIDEQSLNYEAFREAGCLIHWTPPKQFQGPTMWYGNAFDFTHPEGPRLWWDCIRKLFEDGVSGYWADMGELEIYPEDATRQYMGPREMMQNIYSLTWARALYEGQRACADRRLFTVMRTLYAGIARYGVCSWSSDVQSNFETLHRHVVIAQQVAISGQPWWCTDAGGFQDAGDAYDPELFIRWMQWSVFCSILRVHGQRDTDPWSCGEAYEPIITSFIRLRYRLMPYIYRHARATVDTGMPMVRAMAIAFPEDAEATKQDHQFLFGDALLVAPVTRKGERTRQVYLPKGAWYELDSGAYHAGGTNVILDAPLERIPVLARAGSIVALDADGIIELHVYEGGDAETLFYEDDGESFGYERGECSVTSIGYKELDGTVRIGSTKGTFEGQNAFRRYAAVFHSPCGCARTLPMPKRLEESLTLHRPTQVIPTRTERPLFDLEPNPCGCTVRFGRPDVTYHLPVGWRADESQSAKDRIVLIQQGALRAANAYLQITSPIETRVALGTGWITWWNVAGPYEDGIDGFHRVYAPEQALCIAPDRLEADIRIERHENMWYSGFVDLKKRFSIRPGEREMSRLTHRTAYAECIVVAPREMEARLRVMADDRMKLWLNGDLVGLIDEGYTREFQFRVRLKAGENRLFLKCSQWIPHMWKEYSARAWGFNAGILDARHCPTDELTFKL